MGRVSPALRSKARFNVRDRNAVDKLLWVLVWDQFFPHLFILSLSVLFIAEAFKSPSAFTCHNYTTTINTVSKGSISWSMNYERMSACESICFPKIEWLEVRKMRKVVWSQRNPEMLVQLVFGWKVRKSQIVSVAIAKRQAAWHVFLRLLHGMWTSLVPSMYQSCSMLSQSICNFKHGRALEVVRERSSPLTCGQSQGINLPLREPMEGKPWDDMRCQWCHFFEIYLRSYDFIWFLHGLCRRLFFHTPIIVVGWIQILGHLGGTTCSNSSAIEVWRGTTEWHGLHHMRQIRFNFHLDFSNNNYRSRKFKK